MSMCLYQVETNQYPSEIGDPDTLLLVHDPDEDPQNLNIADFNFLTTLAIKSEDSDAVIEEFKLWWQENVGSEMGLELITEDPRRLKAERREEIESLEDDCWTLNTCFVAYPRQSEDAYLSAQDTIKSTELNILLNS